ncbi:MAG: Lipolytic protein G-D-S-L family [uncultured Sulfurovum sp.]|uniref:Lipolytic protein G-D-S-L family n=1 Tax=uncultured Sulfurovum sp. TaxID=269237 RepID=A0A6S6UDJ9_9BACT|nr:MAG: Lipolytic protein G-D-S-L family [uncultured Sulfurovum sp.]
MKKRIVILGDSLGMPRPEVRLEETYPYILQTKLTESEVFAKHRRANDSAFQSEFLNIQDDIEYMKADILVIHLGVVDCAPRLFSRAEQKGLRYLKKVNKYIISFMSKRRVFFTKIFPKVYVKLDDFEQNMDKLLLSAKRSAKRVIIVNIADTSQVNKRRSYDFEKNIVQYNEVLSQLKLKHDVELLDVYNILDESMLLDDGIHINVTGSKVVAEKLEELCR